MFEWVENKLLAKVWNIKLTLENNQPENMCDIVFQKTKGAYTAVAVQVAL